jgi:phosphohistidine phosphatase
MAKSSAPSWFYEQSSVIPFRRGHRGIEILLITSRGRRRWIFPKGVIDPGLSARASARKEAREEGGIEGRVLQQPVGEYSYEKWNGSCRVQVFALLVENLQDHWDEEHFRKRKWVSAEKAADMLDQKDLRMMLKRFLRDLDTFLP